MTEDRVSLSYWDRKWIKDYVSGQAFAACMLGALLALVIVAVLFLRTWHDEQDRVDRLEHRVHVLEVDRGR